MKPAGVGVEESRFYDNCKCDYITNDHRKLFVGTDLPHDEKLTGSKHEQ